jgi:serine/threonine protein phosphatase PrpC
VETVPPSHTSFMVAASDGLWDVITEERAAGLIIKVE